MTGQQFKNLTFIEKNNFEVFNCVLLQKQTTPKNNFIAKTDNSKCFYMYFFIALKSQVLCCVILITALFKILLTDMLVTNIN